MPAKLLISCSWGKDGFGCLVFATDGAHIADMGSSVGYKFPKGGLMGLIGKWVITRLHWYLIVVT